MRFTVYGFSDDSTPFKKFQDSLDDRTREKLSGILEVQGKTFIGSALSEGSMNLRENKGKENFLIVLTDGDTNSVTDIPWPEVRELAQKIETETGQKIIGIGLGPQTEHVRDVFPRADVSYDVKKLPEVLSGLLEDIFSKRI